MSRKVVLASTAAFALGAVLIHSYLQELERQTSGGAPVDVLVAVRDLSPGATLDESAIGVRQVPEAYVDARRIRAKEVQDVLGVPVTTAIAAGEAVLWSDLAGTTLRGRQLSSLVGEGMRAVTITSRTSLFEGLLRPGDRVDVLVTLPEGSTPSEGPVTYTLLQNVLVLSVGGNLGSSEETASKSTSSVNVSVTAQDAQALAQAEQRGRIRLVLRNPNDVELLPVKGAPEVSPPKVAPIRSTHKEIEHVR
ncbi:MAG TPA: Flp pilus assembly protein CpaB [Polyangiaceae bacterium]|nr:Flp pilus assembly protein CpaB [Polyangiaceae bacterium]